jgi:multiple sugar transport system permease protein
MTVGVSGWKRAALAAAFLAPSFIPLLLFLIVPMVSSIGLSFVDWNLIGSPHWAGLGNYRRLWHDGQFHQALLHTLYFVSGYLPIVFFGGLAIALALHQRLRGLAWIRTVYFLPVVTSWVVVALVWKWLLNPQFGLVNLVLGKLGIPGPGWWTDPHWAMPSVILASSWKDIGFTMVLFLGGLQAIPDEYYEAAAIDGAGRWQRFRRITLPLLSPTSFFVVVISLINNFQVFDQVWVMTGGGPVDSTSVVVQQIVQNAFTYSRMGYAAAMSWVLFAIILSVTFVQLRLQRRWVNYG